MLIAAGLALGAAELARLEKYKITDHPPNPWTPQAALNVLATSKWFEKARTAINGRFNSVYRSPQVNKTIGGAATSRHMQGLACDIGPGTPWTPQTAAAQLWAMHKRGELGPIQQVIWEPTWVHVGWWGPGEEPSKPVTYLKKEGDKFVSLV